MTPAISKLVNFEITLFWDIIIDVSEDPDASIFVP
jgi:hypothetical protein